MPKSLGLNHIAMSVPSGSLTDEYVDDLLDFYGHHLGWKELEDLRRTDRLTVAVGGATYINIRERDESMVCHGYEHFGIRLGSAGEVEQLWTDLRADIRDVEVGELDTGNDGFRVFRFRYLLPLTVEVQFFP